MHQMPRYRALLLLISSLQAAEHEFAAGDAPREAIDMYLHARDWAAATRVAENWDPASLPDVYCAQVRDWWHATAFI